MAWHVDDLTTLPHFTSTELDPNFMWSHIQYITVDVGNGEENFIFSDQNAEE